MLGTAIYLHILSFLTAEIVPVAEIYSPGRPGGVSKLRMTSLNLRAVFELTTCPVIPDG